MSEEFGYEVVEGEFLRSTVHNSTPQQRASDLNGFFADPEIDVVWPIG